MPPWGFCKYKDDAGEWLPSPDPWAARQMRKFDTYEVRYLPGIGFVSWYSHTGDMCDMRVED